MYKEVTIHSTIGLIATSAIISIITTFLFYKVTDGELKWMSLFIGWTVFLACIGAFISEPYHGHHRHGYGYRPGIIVCGRNR